MVRPACWQNRSRSDRQPAAAPGRRAAISRCSKASPSARLRAGLAAGIGPSGPCGPQLRPAKARCSRLQVRSRVSFASCCPRVIYRVFIGRAATGSPQPSPGEGPLFASRRSASSEPSASCCQRVIYRVFIGRAATGSPQPPPGGGLHARVRRPLVQAHRSAAGRHSHPLVLFLRRLQPHF